MTTITTTHTNTWYYHSLNTPKNKETLSMPVKKLDLYFYNDDDRLRVSNKPPVRELGDDYLSPDRKGVNIEICERGLEVFGLKDPGEGKVVKLSLTVDDVELGDTTFTIAYKPYPVPKARARKGKKKR